MQNEFGRRFFNYFIFKTINSFYYYRAKLLSGIRRSHEGIKVRGLTSWRYIIQFHATTKMDDQVVYEVDGSKKVEAFSAIVKLQNSTVLLKLT